jgi:DNA-binding GntR family transcriptional regulator
MQTALIQMKTLSERAYWAIKDLILKNNLLPGKHLSISALAESLAISQTPVREALARLSADGLIDYEPHKKLRVATITEEDVLQVYEVRKLLEPYAASLVIGAISRDLSRKENIQKVYEKAKEICRNTVDQIDYKDYLSIDLSLNDIFVEAAGKTLFREMFTLIGDRSLRIRTFVEAVSKASPNKMIHTITREHLQILEALLRQDSDEAQQRVYQHLQNGEARTIKAIRNRVNIQ